MTRLALLAALLLAAGSAAAQETRFIREPPDELVRALMRFARDNLHRARDTRGNPLPAETALERRAELLDRADARNVIDVGMASAAARWCGLDWRASQRALVAEARASGQRTERQIAYIAVLHDVTMASLYSEVRGRPCPAEERARVVTYLAQRWRN